MREIKFRAQDFTKTWNYGYVAMGNESAVLFPKMKDGSVMIDIQIYVLPETVGQYTGLKDKNGTEIYEGDIISFVDGQKQVNGEWIDNEHIYSVEYSEASFKGVCGLSKCLDAVEVIGNIYDNPELLTKTK
ncbi:MAG: hypothetical protein IJ200_12730 [Prevotella sp.]|nr:hypothetical protein [Prevotella sp.]